MKDHYKHSQTVKLAHGKEVAVEHDYVHSAPMAYERREGIYRRQNGYRPLTDRQERNLARCRFRAYVKAARS